MKFEYVRPGFYLGVFDNRVEVREGIYKPIAKKTTILFKNITGVEIVGITRKLVIKTNDGKSYEYQMGLTAENAKAAIVAGL